MAGKFDIQKIISDVKSMITPVEIPEASKDDPVGYHLSELNKVAKELAENQTKQADVIARLNTVLGSLYQEITKGKPQAPEAKAKAEEKKEEAPASEEKPKEEEKPAEGEEKAEK